ncbi:MAG: energy transducer TonB [Acidobacteria bacterium]|jgi:protein TonB|nr:energy transducer TonB [Acidobacteriota bacterium]
MIDRRTLLVGMLVAVVAPLGAAALQAGEPVRYDEATMSEPKVIHKVAPRYPEDAKKEGVQGVVVLDAVIAEDGTVRETRVVQGEDARLVEAARTAVGQWRYEPVRDEDGKPMELIFTVTIRFALS